MSMEFGLSDSEILDCLEVLRTEKLENVYKFYPKLKMEPKLELWEP